MWEGNGSAVCADHLDRRSMVCAVAKAFTSQQQSHNSLVQHGNVCMCIPNDEWQNVGIGFAALQMRGVHITLRMRLFCEVYRNGKPMKGQQYEVLNEVVVDRGANPYLTQIECYEQGRLITKVRLHRQMTKPDAFHQICFVCPNKMFRQAPRAESGSLTPFHPQVVASSLTASGTGAVKQEQGSCNRIKQSWNIYSPAVCLVLIMIFTWLHLQWQQEWTSSLWMCGTPANWLSTASSHVQKEDACLPYC